MSRLIRLFCITAANELENYRSHLIVGNRRHLCCEERKRLRYQITKKKSNKNTQVVHWGKQGLNSLVFVFNSAVSCYVKKYQLVGTTDQRPTSSIHTSECNFTTLSWQRNHFLVTCHLPEFYCLDFVFIYVDTSKFSISEDTLIMCPLSCSLHIVDK